MGRSTRSTLAELRGIRWREIYRDLQIMRLCFKPSSSNLRFLLSLPSSGTTLRFQGSSRWWVSRREFSGTGGNFGKSRDPSSSSFLWKIVKDRKKEWFLGSWNSCEMFLKEFSKDDLPNIFFPFLQGFKRSEYRILN